MASREEILANFQACTGIEDVEVAICQLEEANWSLLDAVNKAIPSNDDPPPPPPLSTAPTSGSPPPLSGTAPPIPPRNLSGSSSSSAIQVDGDSIPPPSPPLRVDSVEPMRIGGASSISIADDFFPGPSSSYGPRTRMLEFNIQHNHDRVFHLKVPDNEDVHTLKTLIQNETGVPPCSQEIRGLKGNYMGPITDRIRLSSLNLPKENVLHLMTPEKPAATNGSDKGPGGDDESDFKLTIRDETHDKQYTLNFRPTHSVLNVKIDVSILTNITVSKQRWTGWPDDINDELSLAQIGIPKEHNLTLKQVDPASTSSTSSKPSTSRSMPEVDMSDSDDDYEDAHEMEDDFFVDNGKASSSRIQPLIPDDYGDEAMGGIKFAEEFANRFGAPHPTFFPGTLKDAIKESCMKPAKERKMLAVYLHHDSSVLTNVFCTQALCADSVVQFLNANFVTFGWDLTFTSNKNRALTMITREFDSVAASTVRNLEMEKLPLLALVYRLRGTTEIFQMIHGNVTLDELMSQLLSAYETYSSQLAVEVMEEEQRAARDAVKREQDLAFEMSLQADREKQAQKDRDEAERKEQERLQEAIRKSEEEARMKEEQEKEKIRQKILARLPEEPADTKDASKLRFRCPDGESLERRFLADCPIQIVFDWLTVKGFPSAEYKVLSSWPRRDLTALDSSQTLKDLKLYPQETLTLEEK